MKGKRRRPAHGNPHREMLEREFEKGRAPFPLARRLGVRFAEFEPGRCVLELPVKAAFHNPMGIVHGGVIFGLLDTTMGFAATSLLEGLTTTSTIDVKINYIRAVRDSTLRAEGRVVRKGRNLIHVEARAWDSEGELVAQALGTAMVVPLTGEALRKIGRGR